MGKEGYQIMTHKEITYLIDQCSQGRISPEKEAELVAFFANLDKEGVSDDNIRDWLDQRIPISQSHEFETIIQSHLDGIFSIDKNLDYSSGFNPIAATSPIHRVHFLRKWSWAAATVVLLAVSAAVVVFLTNNRDKKNTIALTSESNKDIAPGSDKAVLTMADGRKIQLDSAANTILAEKGIVNNNALISYSGTTAASAINTLTTPRGGQYKIKLSDGTMVWLNAASSITYPTVFTGSERTVKITGEAYLEVARDKMKPFTVQAGEMKVLVLGTSFNINAYLDEAVIKTTLIEGSVRVNTYKQLQTLTPGQQAQVSGNNVINIVNDANIEKVRAWKNGLFNFEGASLGDVMKQLERWYNIDVVYEKGIPDIEFGGKMTKDISLKGLLIALEKSEVHFRLEGNKLIVTR